ncbi:uncharacterized protein BKA55DRAFT_543834 [Fusarium redolens]|uniref:Uncharacterized protein n=1 Tax=Fusarium redolens TaxID=48865 RepID=A0A9P9G7U8_FUSRE|nr:uncharacterized protein BKA55DRAFT_543834 [Fusarium redolens]KAH7234649.1 hypothetical protein BKA55DRAFT_543834 [Fusarium redolens]
MRNRKKKKLPIRWLGKPIDSRCFPVNQLRRREEAEERASASQPLTLHRHLETCHSLSAAIEVVTDRSLTTQGDTTNPTGRIYPRRIIPWTTFPTRQEEIWDQLSFSPWNCSRAAFPSRHQLEYVRSLLRPWGNNDATPQATQPGHSSSKGSGKGQSSGSVCIYRTTDDRNIPTVAIEYKPPHRLSQDEVVTGFVSEIEPDRDVINQDGEEFAFAAKRLTTAVVTQLFSYMAIRSPPPSQAWHSAAENLDIWRVEDEDVFRSIPETKRKEKRVTPYRPQRWKGFVCSPIRTRSRCLPAESGAQQPSDDDNDYDGSPSPTSDRVRCCKETSVIPKDTKSSNRRDGGGAQQGDSINRQSIQDRPYCTHKTAIIILNNLFSDDLLLSSRTVVRSV